jgi:hypothetical protein
MTANREQCDDRTSVNRRTVLGTIGGAAVPGAFAAVAESQEESSDAAQFAVVQDDQCVPVVPLSGDQPVEDLYDYQVPTWQTGVGATSSETGPYYQSNGTTDLQSADTTITFLYDGPNGLSLVVVHDAPGNDGGAAKWTIDGVPDDASWAVQDDRYFDSSGNVASTNYDTWDVGGSTHTVDWTWGDAGTDGGALRGLGEEFTLTIDPAFNGASDLWGQYYAEDPITDWQVLSFPDGGDSPTRTSLALDRQATIRAGGCGGGGETEARGINPTIDVKPGSDPAPINPRSNGVIPVAIQSSDAFGPDDIDVGTLRFGPLDDEHTTSEAVVAENGASPVHDGQMEDANGNGDADLLVHFPTAEAGFGDGDSVAKLAGETADGTQFSATDSIRIVGNGGGNDGDDQDDEPETEEQAEQEEEREEQEEDDDDGGDESDDDRPGNGNGGRNGRGNGNGGGNGNGQGRGNGNGGGNGQGHSNGNGLGNGR